MNPHLPYWLAALYLQGVGPRKFLHWLSHFETIENLFNASLDEYVNAGITSEYIRALKNPNWEATEKDLRWSDVPGNTLITFDDENYPPWLKEISDPPLLLFVQGNKSALVKTQLAIVGSRRATHHGLKNAEQFAYHLAVSGLAITSGMALGIDAASHRGALAAKGITIAVAGTGLEHIYPPSHRNLVKEIINNEGAIISEFPLSTPPQAWNFPRRNRIIGGLSLGVLIVEAAIRSGSLITARHALDQGRDVFAIPGSIHQPLSRGCHFLIKQGAKLVETAADILEELSFASPMLNKTSLPKDRQLKDNDELGQQERSVLEQIEYEITPIDVIILRSGLTVAEVSSILLTLELRGRIQSVPGGYVREIATK